MDVLSNVEQLIEVGQFTEAKTKLDSVLKAEPQNNEALYFMGLLTFKRDQYDESVSFLQKAIKITGQDYRYHELIGQAMGFKAQRSGAVKGALLLPKIKTAFLKAIDLNPNALKAKEGLFVFYLFTPSVAGGDEKKAVQIIEDIKQDNPGHAHMLQAMLHAKNKEEKSAVKSVDNALNVCKDDLELLFKAARFYLAHNNVDKALATIEMYIKLKPQDPLAFDAKADCFRQKKEFIIAIELYQKALELNNDFYPGRRKLAECMFEAGDKSSAKIEFEYILQYHPKTPAAAKAKQALKELS